MTEPYYTWQTLEATIAGEPIRWAGKPGLEAWEAIRPSNRLLAEEMSSVGPGQRVLDLRCGVGLCGVLAARRGAEVTLCDDSLVAVQAARRTLELNGASGSVLHGDVSLQAAIPIAALFDLVLLDAPRGREWVQHLLAIAAQVLRPGGKLLLAGPSRGGIKSFVEDARELVGPCEIARIKASHRLAIAEKSGQSPSPAPRSSEGLGGSTCAADIRRLPSQQGEEGSTFREVTVRGQTIHFVTQPGVFSHGKLDAGTRALIETMAIRPGEVVLDLGCGCGIVGAVAAQAARQIVCVDSSAAALQATRATLELNGITDHAQVLASDCASAVHDVRFDVVATNPPFHQGLGVEYDVAQQFVRDAAHVLAKGGRLVLVANRFIRYERVMHGLFADVTTAYEDNRFRVLEAVR